MPAIAPRIWQELARAPYDRHHGWRTPVMATVGLDGLPQGRTVVLRAADAASQTLTVFTDWRSPKWSELLAQPAAHLVFWSGRLQWQLRVGARATLQTRGDLVDTAWSRIAQSPSAGDYLSALPPGTPCEATGRTEPTREGSVAGGHHLGALVLEVRSMDWLELRREGHRRARIAPDGSTTPLAP